MSAFDGIENLSGVPAEAFFDDLRCRFHTGRGETWLNGWGQKVQGYRHGIMTRIGDIERKTWNEAMHRLIERSGEQDLFELLVEHVSGFAWIRTQTQAEEYALELHSSRIFEKEAWADYQDFRVKMLEAGLVPAPAATGDAVSIGLEDFFMEGAE